MSPRTARRVAWALFGLTLVGAVVQFALRLPRLAELGDRYDPYLTFPIITLATLAAALVGAFVVSRHPRNPVGWLFCITNCIAELGLAAVSYAELSGLRDTPLPWAPYAAWFQTFTAAAFALSGLALLLLLFPAGRLPSSRWRVVVWVLGVNFVVMQVSTLVLVGDPREVLPLSELPPGRALGAVVALTQLVVVACVLAAAASIVVRLRRAAGDERQQLRLVTLAAAAVGVSVVFLALYESLLESRGVPRLVPETLFYLSYGMLPVAAGLAMLKYRLYDIDVILNRAVVFAGLVVASTVGYVAVVVTLSTAVGDRLHLGTTLNLLVTAAVAIAVQPARRQVHLLADRIAYGRRAAPYDVLSGFTARIAGTLSVDDVLPQMAAAAAQGVGALAASVHVSLPDGSERGVVFPSDAVTGVSDVLVPVHHLGQQVGRLELSLPPGGALNRASHELLVHLARQAGVALHNVRLTDELRARLRQLSDQSDAVAASRQRLVAARTVERQRLEHEIASLVQPHLASVREGLPEVELAVSDPERAGRLLESLASEATAALDALRDLARGVFPPLLVDHGLLPALQAAARTVAAPLTLIVEPSSGSGDVTLPRYDAVVESAAYFCLRDVLSSPPHAPLQVTLRTTDERLTITVVGAEPPGAVLASATDRASAIGGTVSFTPAPRPTVVVELRVEAARPELATVGS